MIKSIDNVPSWSLTNDNIIGSVEVDDSLHVRTVGRTFAELILRLNKYNCEDFVRTSSMSDK